MLHSKIVKVLITSGLFVTLFFFASYNVEVDSNIIDNKVSLHQHQNNSEPSEVTTTLSFNTNKSEETISNAPPKVLILTQWRSGSSFLGSLLAPDEESFYVFEPFINVNFSGRPIEDQAENPSQEAVEYVKTFLHQIYDCIKPDDLQLTFSLQLAHSKLKKCSNAKIKLLKTVRVRYNTVKDWIRDSDIKVIHLVRDPRAILNSRLLLHWDTEVETVCRNLNQDLHLSSLMNDQNYYRVKYEDLVEETTTIVKKLYDFVGMTFTDDVEQHISKLKNGRQDSNIFFGVERSAGWNINHWRQRMPMKLIKNIEKSCAKFMKIMKYQMIADI